MRTRRDRNECFAPFSWNVVRVKLCHLFEINIKSFEFLNDGNSENERNTLTSNDVSSNNTNTGKLTLDIPIESAPEVIFSVWKQSNKNASSDFCNEFFSLIETNVVGN